MAFNNTIVARVAASIWGLKLGYATTQGALAQANASVGGLNSVINGAFNDSFVGVSNAAISAAVVANLGLTGKAATDGTAYLVAALATVPTAERGAKISEVVALFSTLSADATYGAAASAFNAKVAAATAYSATVGTQDAVLGDLPSASSFNLTLGQDNITGTAGNDTFNAFIFDNSNTLQSGDNVNGGSGTDTLYADMGSSQGFAVTPSTTGVEYITVRGQSGATDSTSNNTGGTTGNTGNTVTGRVDIDAQRIVGATKFESNNSRADVIIEDVRILDSQITKDITIALVETDPGHVDFGLYFDQYSLKNQSSTTSSVTLKIMDTVAAAKGGNPLEDSNYYAFKITAAIPTILGGVPNEYVLGARLKTGPGSIQDAKTYDALLAAFQLALDAEFGPGVAAASFGDNFTVVDPDSKIAVTGKSIVLTTKQAAVFTTPAGSGWLADGTAPPASNFYTQYGTGQVSSTSLVTSTVILDDVGRGSTAGDLVIGGQSTGATSTSLGVQRFEIEVRDNSKMESINSTNNTLQEVTIKNGVTTSGNTAYVTTVKDAGNLTVNGNSGLNGANVTNGGDTDAQAGINSALPGSAAQTARNFGFSDVRLIDGSAMTGRLAFSAEVTGASLAKYLNLQDIQSSPSADNVAFTFNGGTAALGDTLFISIDSGAAASRSTLMAGREDFTFTANGGAGDDAITVFVSPLTPGGDQAWYTNQKLNKNIFVNGGDGNDTIRTPGAGDKIITGGAGNDTLYVDNTGNQAAASGTASLAGAAYAAAAAAELASSLAVRVQSNSTDAATLLTVAANLNTLNLVTPVLFPVAAITHATIATATAAAVTAGALTLAQKIALDAAYNAETGGTVVPPTTLVAPAITGNVAVAGNLTAAEFAAGNALLDTYIAAAKAAAAAATAADANTTAQTALLDATQLAVQNATIAVSGVAQLVSLGGTNGTATNLANLTAIKSALALNATDAQVVAALQAGTANGSLAAAGLTEAGVFAIATGGGAGTIDAAELANLGLTLDPAINALAAVNTAASTALASAITANNSAVRAASNIVGADPVLATASAVANDFVGSTEAAAAAAAAVTAKSTFDGTAVTGLTAVTTVQTDLAALKSALSVGVSDLAFSILTTNAFVKGTITLGNKTALDLAATFGALPTVAGTLDATEKVAVDLILTGLQVTNDIAVDSAKLISANLQSTIDATAFAAAQALAAATASPTGTPLVTYDKAIWVLNTANQQNPSTTAYVLNVNDERNITDLRSGGNESYNFFGSTLTVTFKGIDGVAAVGNTGYKTSDLQINQAIKDAINNNFVLSKLIVATDGPANTLVITSLIDGTMSNANLAVTLALPAAGSISATDLAAAAAVYGATATDAAVQAAMTAAKASFDSKGDYVDQIAETGAFGGNLAITGAPSITTSDNLITPGDGTDVIVLGTTVGSDSLLSSTDTIVYGANFGNDTIVNFVAGSTIIGGDGLNLSALGGNVLTSAFNVNKSVTVAPGVAATNGTAALVAALFTDSLTAQTHVYVAVDANNIGSVYAVVDAAGVGGLTATLAGTIDLADTPWASLTAEDFV